MIVGVFDWMGFLSSPLSTGRIERQLTTRVDVDASVNPEIAVEVHTAYRDLWLKRGFSAEWEVGWQNQTRFLVRRVSVGARRHCP